MALTYASRSPLGIIVRGDLNAILVPCSLASHYMAHPWMERLYMSLETPRVAAHLRRSSRPRRACQSLSWWIVEVCSRPILV
jgi:hypothetical protein